MEVAMTIIPDIEMNGKWLFDQQEGKIYTCWNNNGLILNLGKITAPTNFTLEITAKNKGTVPSGYQGFAIDIYAVNGSNLLATKLGTMIVPAMQTEYKSASKKIIVQPADPAKINLVWVNDYFSAGVYDTNLLVGKVAFEQ
jgi:hypothetical protein